MRYSNNPLIKMLLLGLAIFILISVQQISNATVSEPVTAAGTTIVDKDLESGAVVFKKKGVYFYGLSKSSQLIDKGEIFPKEIIVKFKNQNSHERIISNLITEIKNLGSIQNPSTPVGRNNTLKLALVKLRKENDYFKTLRTLRKNPDVEYAEPNFVVKTQMVPNDPSYSRQWGPQMINAGLAWDKVDPGKLANVTIAILDTGINTSHEDLQSSIVPGYDFVNNDNVPGDGQGHGTHVAGIAAAIINNGKGIAGIAGGAKIMPVKVLGDNGTGSISNIINGIKYATDHGAKIINMSIGGAGTSSAMQDAVNYAINRGVSVVAAAGNNNGPVTLPGNCNGVITVGAIDSTGNRAYYSNYGPEMDVAAPGSNILSSYIGGPSSYASLSGTSMATPAVAGVAALVRAANPNLSPALVADIIHQSAVDKSNPGFDNYYGYGLVDANRAVELALQRAGTTPPGGNPSPTPITTPNPNSVPAPIVSPSPAPVTNLALRKFARASSVEGGTRTAAQAVDGNPRTRWASAPGQDPQWIYVDLGKIYNIKKIVLKWETAYAKSYQVQVSNDGMNWRSVYNTTTGVGGTTTLTGSVNGRFVRMYGAQRGTPWGYSLWEFEVYGN